ncbi:hypothetical protein ACGFRG_01095 [Streptomyces sp. NPDC048696]|uniref:hypothetical protein n=1 Tax=Streptomyces sp. NPDC048696 TaxID=3365585 RepID=UPI003723E134
MLFMVVALSAAGSDRAQLHDPHEAMLGRAVAGMTVVAIDVTGSVVIVKPRARDEGAELLP